MKTFATILLLCLLTAIGYTQPTFTKVTSGAIVEDGSNTRSAAWGDYDGDGDLDVYITVGPGSMANPNGDNLFYQNNCDGAFTRITGILPLRMVNDGTVGSQNSWVDINNDGDLDLYVCNSQGVSNFLFINNGDGTFEDVTTGVIVEPGTFSGVALWADYDNDGDLDNYLANDRGWGPLQNNILYFNDGTGLFTKVDTGSGVVDDFHRFSGACAGDFDNDGDIDIYAPAFFGFSNNFLYTNNGNGTFASVTTGILITDPVLPRKCEWVDYDNDLDLDMFTSTSASPARLYRNDGGGNFTKILGDPLVNPPNTNSEGGSAWGDFDNDGDLDVIIGNNGVNQFFQNNGNGTFTQIVTGVIATDVVTETKGMTWVDHDNDGDLDLFIATTFGSPDNILYFNNNGTGNHFIDVTLTGVTSNRSAIGARIYAYTTIFGNPVSQMREIIVNSRGVQPLNQHFGLGDATTIDSLIVVWPASGTTQKFFNVSADRFIEIEEGNNTILAVVPCKPDFPPVNPAIITGAVVSDSIGQNCAFDVGEIAVSGRLIRAVNQDNQSFFTFSGEDGNYTFELPKDTHTISIVPDPPLTQESVACGVGGLIYNIDATAGGTFSGNDFFLQQACGATVTILPPNYPCTPPTCPLLADTTCCDTINNISFRSGPCIGCDTEYCFEFENTGTVTISSPIFVINLDPNGVFSNVVINNGCGTTFQNIVGNTYTFWGGPAMNQNTPACQICIQATVDACDVATGNLTATAQLNANAGPCTGTPILGAFDSMTEPDCVCPCDPNDKMTRPEGCGPSGNIGQGEELTYKVRFQNVGGSAAQDVLIRDVFDNDLDITTLRVINASDPITSVEVIPEDALIIRFDGINLPDSASDPAGSRGFVIFSIQPKDNLPDGTEITNQAGIYFDQNDVVLTNTVLNTVRDNPNPIADFEASHSCTSTGRVFDFTYTGGTSDGATFDWDFGQDATPSTSTNENPTGITYSSTGSKEITLIVTRFGCVDIITKTLEVEDVSCGNNKVLVCHIPPGNEGNPQTICVNENALAAHLAHGDCIGKCNVPLAKMGGGTEEGEDEEIKSEMVQYEDALQAYPNPFKDMTTLTFEVARTGRVTLEVFDYTGKIVSKLFDKHAVMGYEYSVEYDTSKLPNGIYYAVLQTNKGSQVTKLVLTR